MPEVKETWYFSPKSCALTQKKEALSQTLARNPRAVLCRCSRGHVPTSASGRTRRRICMSTQAAERIAEAQPDARIIAILREPASFLRSFHLQCLRNHVETEKDFGKAIALEDARREGKRIPRHSPRPHELLYSNHVRYVEQLQSYEAVFPAEQILVLIYDDYRRDNEATVRKVLRFLEVDDSLPIEPVEANPSFSVRSPQLNEMVRSVYVGRGPLSRGVKAGVRSITSRSMRDAAVAADSAPCHVRRAEARGRTRDARAAPSLQGRGARPQRAPRPRSRQPSGAMTSSTDPSRGAGPARRAAGSEVAGGA